MSNIKFIKPIIISLLLMSTASAFADNGIANVPSKHSVEKTTNNLVKILTKKGMTIFNQVKHSDSAAKVGININPTQLIIFGNPKIGSPLMKCSPTVALDLPQKMLIWQDNMNKVWVSYNKPSYLKQRHNIKGCDPVLTKVTGALKGISHAATQ